MGDAWLCHWPYIAVNEYKSRPDEFRTIFEDYDEFFENWDGKVPVAHNRLKYCWWKFSEQESDESANPDVYNTECGQSFCVEDDCYSREPLFPENCHHCGKPVVGYWRYSPNRV